MLTSNTTSIISIDPALFKETPPPAGTGAGGLYTPPPGWRQKMNCPDVCLVEQSKACVVLTMPMETCSTIRD